MKLILLNGPSGIGKSTISAQLASEMRNTVIIDIDEIRRSVPNYKENRKESALLSYERAREEIARELESGKNVIVDKGVLFSDTVDSLLYEGQQRGAEVYEFLLFATKEALQKRADDRGYRPGSLITRERVGELWEEANRLRQERPQAILIDTTNLSLEETFNRVRNAIPQEQD